MSRIRVRGRPLVASAAKGMGADADGCRGSGNGTRTEAALVVLRHGDLESP